MRAPSIVIINGSLHGDSDDSNTVTLLRLAEKELSARGANTKLVHPELLPIGDSESGESIYVLKTADVLNEIAAADGLLVGTGTYWGQASSTLQRFVEEATPSEGTDVWLGKPAGMIVSEHSSGGQAVLSNLMLTLSNFGCMIPPQGGMVYSRTGQALEKLGQPWAIDVWSLEDIGSICERLIAYAVQRKAVRLRPWLVHRGVGELNKRWVSGIGDKS